MKTKIITIALITITSFANQLMAQETAVLKTRTKSNQCNERTAGYDLKTIKCRVIPTETGCTIAFDNVGTITGGGGAGKKGYDSYKSMSCFSVSSADNSVSIVSPRDPASGLSTGKRMHKPTPVTKQQDASSAMLLKNEAKGKPSSDSPQSEIAIDEPGVHKVASSGGGAGKASFSDLSVTSAGKATFKEFTVTKRCDGKTTEIKCPNGDCEIPLDDCPNGTCDLVCSWSWGATNTGSMSSGSGAGSGRCAAGFSLEIQDGACTAMAINEKGLPGDKKPVKNTSK